MHTRDTAGTGSGMPRYAKVQHRTRTRTTRLGNTAGFSVPVPNPIDPVHVDPVSVTLVNPNPMATTLITLIGCALIARFKLIHRTVKMIFVPQFNLPHPREVFAVF